MTIRNLLTHAGGYAEYTEREDFDEVGNRPATLSQIVATVDGRPLSFTPGTSGNTRTPDMHSSTMVIERVSKMSVPQFVQRNIFGRRSECHRRTCEPIRHFAKGRDRVRNVRTWILGTRASIDYTWFTGAGSIITNPQDLVKWNAGLPTLLSKRSLTEMLTPIEIGTTFPGMRFGIAVNKLPNGHRMISHGGNTTGAATQDARFPEDNLSIVVLANSGTFSYDPAVMAIYGVLVPSARHRKPANAKPAARSIIRMRITQMVAAGEHWLDQAVCGNVDMACSCVRTFAPGCRCNIAPTSRR